MVFEKISKLKPFKAPDTDEIHPYTLKECSYSLCEPLYAVQSITPIWSVAARLEVC